MSGALEVMRKPKAAAILGALIVCGLVVLASGIRPYNTTTSLLDHVTSRAMAATDPLFARLQSAFTRACSDQAALLPSVPDFFDACAIVARAVKSTDPTEGLFREIDKELKDSSQGSQEECDACVDFVREFENALVANNSPQGLQEALEAACERRLTKPADLDRCRALVAQIPVTINLFLGNLPPLVFCRQLNRCPL